MMLGEMIPEIWIPRSAYARLALLGLFLRLLLVTVLGTMLSVAVYQPVGPDWFTYLQWARIGLIPVQFLLFGIWLNSLRKSLESAGLSDFRYGAGWTIGGFLVPVVNFFMPFIVAAELWKASDAEAPTRPASGLTWSSAGRSGSSTHVPRESGLPVIVWWTLFWLSQIADYVVDAIYDSSIELSARWMFHTLDAFELATEFAWMLASVWLVAVLAQRVSTRVDELTQADTPSESPPTE